MPSLYKAQIKHAQHYNSVVKQQSQMQADYTWLRNEINQLECAQSQLGSQLAINTQYLTETAKLLVDITENVVFALHNYGQRVQALEWCKQALLICDRFQYNPARLFIAKARLEAAFGNIPDATESLQQAAKVSTRMDLEYAQSLLGLASLELGQGEYQHMLEKLQSIASLLEQQGHNKYIILVDYQIAMYYLKRGDFQKALTTLLQLEKELHQNPKLASLYPGTEVTELQYIVWFQVGCIYRKLAIGSIKSRASNYQMAKEYLEKLNKESKDRIHREMVAASAHHLGWIYLNRGEVAQALDLVQESQEVYEDLRRTAGIADVYEQLGLLYIANNQPEIGLCWIQKSLQLREQINNKHGAASSMRRIAIAQFHLKLWRQALKSLKQSVQMYRDIDLLGLKRLIGMTLEILDWTVGRRRFTL